MSRRPGLQALQGARIGQDAAHITGNWSFPGGTTTDHLGLIETQFKFCSTASIKTPVVFRDQYNQPAYRCFRADMADTMPQVPPWSRPS
jgi:hypothetical protein